MRPETRQRLSAGPPTVEISRCRLPLSSPSPTAFGLMEIIDESEQKVKSPPARPCSICLCGLSATDLVNRTTAAANCSLVSTGIGSNKAWHEADISYSILSIRHKCQLLPCSTCTPWNSCSSILPSSTSRRLMSVHTAVTPAFCPFTRCADAVKYQTMRLGSEYRRNPMTKIYVKT